MAPCTGKTDIIKQNTLLLSTRKNQNAFINLLKITHTYCTYSISHSNYNKSKRIKILKHCHSKFDCLLYKMMFIRHIKPSLSVQSDSIKAKLFIRPLFDSYHCFGFLLFVFIIMTYIIVVLYIPLRSLADPSLYMILTT